MSIGLVVGVTMTEGLATEGLEQMNEKQYKCRSGETREYQCKIEGEYTCKYVYAHEYRYEYKCDEAENRIRVCTRLF